MKKACIVTLIFVLTATLFTGCRNMGNNTTHSTVAPGTSSSSKPTVVPTPEIPLPSDTHTTNPSSNPGTTTNPGSTAGTEGSTGVTGRSARGPRY